MEIVERVTGTSIDEKRIYRNDTAHRAMHLGSDSENDRRRRTSVTARRSHPILGPGRNPIAFHRTLCPTTAGRTTMVPLPRLLCALWAVVRSCRGAALRSSNARRLDYQLAGFRPMFLITDEVSTAALGAGVPIVADRIDANLPIRLHLPGRNRSGPTSHGQSDGA